MCIREHINSASKQIQECFEVWKKIKEKFIATNNNCIAVFETCNFLII
jgi:hypothetical protein